MNCQITLFQYTHLKNVIMKSTDEATRCRDAVLDTSTSRLEWCFKEDISDWFFLSSPAVCSVTD